jgi:hypothetical protein
MHERALSSLSLFCAAAAASLVACAPPPPEGIVGVSPPRAPEMSDRAIDAGAPEPSPVPEAFRSTMTRASERFVSRGHGQRFEALVWADPQVLARWDTPAQIPTGALVLEESFVHDGADERPGGLLVMQKQATGWRFSAVTPEGEVASLIACSTCHEQSETGLFALPRTAAADAATEAPPSRPSQ